MMSDEKVHQNDAPRNASINKSRSHKLIENDGFKTSATSRHSAPLEEDGGTMISKECLTEMEESSIAEITEHESEQLLQMTVEEMERMFEKKLHLVPETDLKSALLLDYFVLAAHWGQQQKYNAQQMCEFFLLVHGLFSQVVEESMEMADLVRSFHCWLTGAAKDDNGLSQSSKLLVTEYKSSNLLNANITGCNLFTTEQEKAIISYASSSMFQHLKLYQFVFSSTQAEEIISGQLTIELPVPSEATQPPCLDEGMPQSIVAENCTYLTPELEASSDEDSRPSTADVILPQDLVRIFAKLTTEEIRDIVSEASTEVMGLLQADTENKMRARENSILDKVRRMAHENL